MGLSFRRMPTWFIRRRRRERRRQWDLRAALPRGSVWYSRAHREPLFSTSHSSSGDTGPLSTHHHRRQLGLLPLSRMSRRSGCSSGGVPQFVSVLQLWAAGSLCTELPNATQVRSAIEPTGSEAECGPLQAGASALHHPRGYS